MAVDPLLVLVGDCRQLLAELPAESVQCCVTSPPYWRLRHYAVNDQQKLIGLEETLVDYIANLVETFRSVHRVLRKDGTLWINIGDSHASDGGAGWQGKNGQRAGRVNHTAVLRREGRSAAIDGFRPKNMMGVPWRLAFALQDDGWNLRSEVIWHKPNPTPESVRDRPTKSHEKIFLFSKSKRYFYRHEETRDPVTGNAHPRGASGVNPKSKHPSGWAVGGGRSHREIVGRYKANASFSAAVRETVSSRNWRDVWTFPTESYKGAHFATFPRELPRRCITASTKPGDVVLDCFAGTGTTGLVALQLARRAVLMELSAAYAEMARERCRTNLALPF